MEVLEAIYGRRSVRYYTDEPVTPENVLEIIQPGALPAAPVCVTA